MDDAMEEVGLNTHEALNRLYVDIENLLKQYKLSQKSRKSKSWIKDALHHNSPHTIMNWMSVVLIFSLAALLVFSYTITGDGIHHIYEALVIIALLVINVAFQLYDNRLRHSEIPNRVKKLLELIEKLKDVKWSPEEYPHPCSPVSPCITLQWTYRDNKIVNLPWALLVKGDVVLIRPGQLSPGYCESVDKCAEYPLLHAREVYGPSLQTSNEIFSIPRSRKPLENRRFRLLETPYINSLRVALEQAQDRPVSQHNKQRSLIVVKLIERIVLPIFLITVILVNFIRLIYLESYVGKASSVDLFLLIPVATLLPLMQLIMPMAWMFLTYFGLARLKTILEESAKSISKINLLEEQDNVSINRIEFRSCRSKVCQHFLSVIQGKGNIMARTANLLHVLGSLTALCCVDKKGILSWPNPTAEKVFFLHNTDNLSDSSSLANFGELRGDGDSIRGGGTTDLHHIPEENPTCTVGEVLDLTHNQSDPFQLHFDDTKWNKHLSSLKPLGLAILLNTCNIDTQELYSKFYSHITCEAIYNDNLIPVTNRRCLCELAKEIGFVEQAQKIFTLEQQLSTFRHLQPEMVRRDNKYARSLSLSTKLKFPFPHMFAVVVKEKSSGSTQLLSQGTADIILDSCVDYWDGHDLCPLTASDRKKIQDFYQRSSLTAYCTAFAYRPLSKGVSNKLSQVYLELPSDSRHLYHTHRSPTPVHWDCSRSVLEPKIKTPLGPFFSTDSLLYNDSPCSDVSDAESCFDMQCNQVFIGMVTMQYQVQSDMVHLVEQLERACIRFVHFSKENELRSRVFSEKMGLESGWNCHISLLSDRNSGLASNAGPGGYVLQRRISQSARKLHASGSPTFDYKFSNLESSRTMSFSAPSAINMEHSVVKFNTENQPLMRDSGGEDGSTNLTSQKNNTSVDSMQMQTEICNTQHDWQSLSGLTDSTEHSAPINFDLSNRAKLPRGIENIRPHIERIDNVPLLVSLFTDCTASGTREMLHIMQEYDEVVCVLGSSASNENMGIFMQADASIAVEPLYPQVCQKVEPYKLNGGTSPIELSSVLNSIACSLSLKREDPISIYYLIMEARHYTSSIWSTVQFWLCSLVAVSFMQAVSALFMLPALLSPGQVLWLVCLVVPSLSISLMGTPIDPEIMKKPQSKNQSIFNAEVATFVLWCYGTKFLPMILVIIVTFAGTLSSHCMDVCGLQNCTCTLFYLPTFDDGLNISNKWTDVEHSYTLLTAQHFTIIIILLHFIAISAGFVYRQHLFWHKSPHTNYFWLTVVIFLLIIQPIYTTFVLLYSSDERNTYEKLDLVHAFQIFAFCSPLLTILVNEIVKKQEIKVNLRYQRRARLDFGTKLGMNSPF